MGISFYEKCLKSMVDANQLNHSDKILVICGGLLDKKAFEGQGFKNVVISNLDPFGEPQDYLPYEWRLLDAEDLDLSDNCFDWVFVHAGLHHCASPQKALCEMMRVSKAGIGVFEARDSFLMRLGVLVGLVPSYEMEPIATSKGIKGGYRNGPIPNFVYRWTEREVEKVVRSFEPRFKHNFYYFYSLRSPARRLAMSKSRLVKSIGKFTLLFLPMITKVFKKQGNEFAFFVCNRQDLVPWLKKSGDKIEPDMKYIDGILDAC